MSEEALLITAALAMGKRDLGGRAIDAMIADIEGSPKAARSFRRLWPRLRQAVGHAIDYLVANFGVANHGFLPSEYMVAVLALFFLHNRNRRPSRAARDQLRRWFWATVVGTRYTGRGFRPNILADAQRMERLALTGRAPSKTTQRTPLHVLRHADYSRRSMLTDGYFCLLRLHRPRYLEDGEELPSEAYSTRANRHDKHHIFPRQQLANRGMSSSEYNCVANICFLVARENQSIGSKQPRRYLEELPQGRRQMIRALRSHLIPFDKDTGLWDPNLRRGFKRFIAQRAVLISRAFEEQAGLKLFSRD